MTHYKRQKVDGKRSLRFDPHSTIYLLPSTFYLLPSPFSCCPRRRILLRLVVEHEHPVDHLAPVGRGERTVAGVRELADDARAPVRGLNHHALTFGAGDRVHADARTAGRRARRPSRRCRRCRASRRTGTRPAPGTLVGTRSVTMIESSGTRVRNGRDSISARPCCICAGARLVDRLVPRHQRAVDRLAARASTSARRE